VSYPLTEEKLREETVLILAPVGQDARLAESVLKQSDIHSETFRSLSELCQRLDSPAAALLITEEAITPNESVTLKSKLADQPKWSDMPIVLLTSRRDRQIYTQQILDFFSTGGNISLLERPFRTMTLVTALRVALRARKRQYQVRDLLREQQIALNKRDEFLSVASHELKTPITSIKLNVQMRKRFLKRGDQSVYSPEKVNALIATTENQVERLSRLVDDMLDVSRIENGKLSLNLEPVEFSSLVETVYENFAPQFETAGASVTLEAKEPVKGSWDRYRLEQVVANLFTNAIKYGAGKPVHVGVKAEADHAILYVRDSGIGIAPEDQKRVFKRFERAKSATSIAGLGLGLYITREIVEMHGGRIRVQSVLGEGSTFVVELPTVSSEERYDAR
jgi:signal transduction histidine kinase